MCARVREWSLWCEAKEGYELNLDRYLKEQFAFAFAEIDVFLRKIEDLIATRGTGDVQIHVSKTQLLALIDAHPEKVIRDGLRKLHSRMGKHLSKDMNLHPEVWDRFVDFSFKLWKRYADRTQQCYETRLVPTPDTFLARVLALAQKCSSLSSVSSSAHGLQCMRRRKNSKGDGSDFRSYSGNGDRANPSP